MSNFVDDPAATLPGPKRDLRSIPAGADRNQYLDADGYNALRQALLDVKGAVQPGSRWETAVAETTSAKAGAEAARDAALIQAGVYLDEPTGRAAVADGVAFKVQGSGDVAAYEYRRVNAGSSTLIATYPASAPVTALQGAVLPAKADTPRALDYAVDLDDNVYRFTDADGGLHLAGLDVTVQAAAQTSVNRSDSGGNLELAVDADERVYRRTAANGEMFLPGLVGSVQAEIKRLGVGTYDAELLHVIAYGQSLAEGYNAIPPLTTVQRHNSVRFVGGVRPTDGGSPPGIYASLVSLVETEFSTMGETPTAGTLEEIHDAVLAENGIAYSAHNFQLLGSAAGEGAMTIAQLSKGSAWYTELLAHVTAGLAAATARDQTYLVGAVTWTQGEADYLANTAAATYVTSLNTLVSDLNSDIKAITGQARDVHVITNQLASHKFYGRTDPLIAKALLTATANPLVHLAVPMYWLTHAADNIHLVARSSKVMGAYYGLVYKRVVVDGATWTPLQPVSAQRLGKVAVIKFNVPVAPLVLDTTLVTVNTNYGFELVDSGGSPLTISSVALTGDNRVKITAAATIPAGAKVRYAWTGAGAVGPVNGPRGNLRDSQGGVVVFSPTDLAVPLHNWCPIFEYAL